MYQRIFTKGVTHANRHHRRPRGNPCEAIERPKTVPGHARGMNGDEIQKLGSWTTAR
jgi:hypothetical protein